MCTKSDETQTTCRPEFGYYRTSLVETKTPSAVLGDKKDQMSIVVCESLPQVVVRPRMELLWMPRLGYRDNMDLRKRKETPGDYRVIHIRSSVCVCL